MPAGSIRQGCINKREGKIHTATRRLEHALQQAIDRLGAQVQAGQFAFAVAGDKRFRQKLIQISSTLSSSRNG